VASGKRQRVALGVVVVGALDDEGGREAADPNDPVGCSDSCLSAKPSLSTTGVGARCGRTRSSAASTSPRVGSLTVRMPVYSKLPGIHGGAGATDVNRINVIGSGRVGAAVAARVRERGVDVDSGDPELVLLCVPDSAIVTVAAGIEPGPWVAHV